MGQCLARAGHLAAVQSPELKGSRVCQPPMLAHLQELWGADSHQTQDSSAGMLAQLQDYGLAVDPAAVGCHWQGDCFAASPLPCVSSLVKHQSPAAAPCPPGLQDTQPRQLLLIKETRFGYAGYQVTHGTLWPALRQQPHE